MPVFSRPMRKPKRVKPAAKRDRRLFAHAARRNARLAHMDQAVEECARGDDYGARAQAPRPLPVTTPAAAPSSTSKSSTGSAIDLKIGLRADQRACICCR